MVPDASGPTGRTFCNKIIKLGYRNLYYRRNEEGLTKKVSDKPGVFLNPTEKTTTLSQYRDALKAKVFIQRCHEANQECLSYIYTTGNTIEHSSAKNSDDPSGAGKNHGDRVIADALACRGLELIGANEVKDRESTEAPPNCYAARKRERELKKKNNGKW